MPYDRSQFEVIAGDSFERTFEWRDSTGSARNLSSYDISMEFRKREDSSASILTLTEGSGITIAGNNLSGTWTVTPAQMLTLVTDAGGSAGEDCFIVFDLVATISTTFKKTLVPGLLKIYADADR